MTIIKIGRHANPKYHTDVLKLPIRVHIFTPEVSNVGTSRPTKKTCI